MKIAFLKYSKIYFIFSGLLVLVSIGAIFIYGLNLGIDFKGGTVLQVAYTDGRPAHNELVKDIENLGLENFTLRFKGEKIAVIRAADIEETKKQKISDYFYQAENIDKASISFESVSPIIGRETKDKAFRAIFYSIIAIIIYVAIVFRKVSKPIRSWQYGIATVIALIHDVLIPIGLFALLGYYLDIEFSIPILTALLTVFGYSVNDTVVVFDRIRENLILGKGDIFDQTVNISLNQTLMRSINTSLTTLFVLLALFFLAGQSLTWFSLALIVGIIAGTYSSIFLAAPLLVKWLAFSHRD